MRTARGSTQADLPEIRRWLEVFPEKVTFGTDAFPYGEALGVEEGYWLGAQSARKNATY